MVDDGAQADEIGAAAEVVAGDVAAVKVTEPVLSSAEKKEKTKLENLIRSNLFVYVNCLVPDPRFESQSKLELKTPRTQFKVKVKDPRKVLLQEEKKLSNKEDIYVHNDDGSIKTAGAMCELDDTFLQSVINRLHITEDVEQIRAVLEHKQLVAVSKGGKGSIINADDYERANWAGTKRGNEATLCLPEGKSAAAMIMQGFSVVGRDKWGLYPLRGKGMNVRGVKNEKMLANVEYNDIRVILGLEFGKKYTDDKALAASDKEWTHISALNYGHLMICADQDNDGFHICSLCANWIDTYWPSLLQCKGFLQRFQTPLIKATNKRNVKEVLPFFSQAAFDAWKVAQGPEGQKQYWVKFYKGLGTSGGLESRAYFRNLGLHRRDFVWASPRCNEALESAFGKSAKKRKDLINKQHHAIPLGEELSYETYINNQFREFAIAVLRRAIPSIVDGFKPVQRKVRCFFYHTLPIA